MKVYFISGLGAEPGVFRNIKLPAGFEPVYLEWISHQKNESLPNYAMRMAERIHTAEPFVLIGLSFGGMLATEIAKRYKPVATILIASVPVSSQIPRYYKLGGMLRLHKIIPVSLVKSRTIARYFFNVKSTDDKKLLEEIIRTTNIPFTLWGIDAILKWKNTEIPQPVYQIHGNKDRMLPVRHTRPTHTLIGSGHMMVLSRGIEISDILRDILII